MEKKERKKTKAVVKKDIYTLTFHKVSKGTSINDVWFVFDFLIIFFFGEGGVKENRTRRVVGIKH